ncbi:ABC transporter G family member 42 [Zea mays]|uniref:ABC transporter G family member 42 n=1 Tax=Zea mays TaxID=4577 RepID=A0A3L6FSL5_MAIZE|nr:ABC transporter G family member 42 [Zea mays]
MPPTCLGRSPPDQPCSAPRRPLRVVLSAVWPAVSEPSRPLAHAPVSYAPTARTPCPHLAVPSAQLRSRGVTAVEEPSRPLAQPAMGPHRFPFRAARAPRYLSLGYIEFTFEDFFAPPEVCICRTGLVWIIVVHVHMLLVDPSRLRYADSDVAAANGGVIPGPNRFSLEFGSHSVSTLSCFVCAFLNFLHFGINCPRLEGDATTLRMVIGLMYTIVMFVGINNCSNAQPIVSIERTVFYRERAAAGMYSAMPYVVAQAI